MILDIIAWNTSPTIFGHLRWYGLMFAIGFWIGTLIMTRMFEHERAPEKWIGILLIYTVLGTVIGVVLPVVLFSIFTSKRSVLWTLDRLCVPTALVAGLIRLGNLFNSEIFGHKTYALCLTAACREWQSFSICNNPTNSSGCPNQLN